jgi:hypothetical protein
LALDTLIPTADRGMVAMGDLAVGDIVFTPDGLPTRISYASPVFIDNDCYRVTFDDGAFVVADAGHLWVVQSRQQRIKDKPPSVVTTEQMAVSVNVNGGKYRNWSVDVPAPFQGGPVDLPVPPYTLGAWLGDGCSSAAWLATADREVLAGMVAEGVSVGPPRECNGGEARKYLLGGGPRGGVMVGRLQTRLREVGVLGDKHIPEVYQFAPVADRWALLKGLMDTDGSCGTDGSCDLTFKSRRLADGALRLIRGLGIKARMRPRTARIDGRDCGVVWRIGFTSTARVFTVKRKLDRVKDSVRADAVRRYVVSVEPVPSVPTRCIAVESLTAQFLCGEGMIPTHNTSFGPHWLYREVAARGPGDYMIVTPTYPLLEKKALPEFRKLFERWLRLGSYVSSPVRTFRFSLAGASRTFPRERWAPGVSDRAWEAWLEERPTTVQFGYAEDPESLESATAKAAWLDEAGQRKFRLAAWEAIRRRLSIHQGRVLITTTPYDLGWLKQTIHDRWAAGDPDIDVVRFDSTENPVFPREEFERARATMPGWKFDLFYRGIFTRPAGQVYGCFRDWVGDEGGVRGHLVKRFVVPVSWPRYAGIDFGGANTAAVLYAGELDSRGRRTGRLVAFAEYHAGGVPCAGHAQAIRRLAGAPIRAAVGGSKSEGQWRLEFKRAGLPVLEPPVSDVEVGIGRVWAAHVEDQVLVFDDLARYRDQKASYARVLDELGEPTEPIEDKHSYHLMDAERYVLAWLRHPRTTGSAGDTARPGVEAVLARLR